MCNYGGGLGKSLKPFVEYNEPGKIMIIETPQSKSAQLSACWGPIESARAKVRGAEGVIVSGNVRQVDQFQDAGLPVLSRGIAALGPREYMRLGSVNETLAIGGLKVDPDDILLADDDGVVVVRQQELSQVIESCEYGVKHDEVVLQAIAEGSTMKEAWRKAYDLLGPPVEYARPFRR
ncbi:hypothetical protein VPNG_04601 [Cytospora leucostoma]|uniref:4-hydroxy-4-methyl-2-oxoglutarate aldolase n=1 Tax=Cytospora leucostoma TaxID=1230097 RepID=A0A423XCG4_9PEZI|nr:hypothetical protein VPNG_04601 [Cytospora leucostoma]